MKVLVTGGTGFIGSSLVPQLEAEGHDVTSLIRYVAGRYDFYKNEKVIIADLRDRDAVGLAVKKVNPEVIINLAAQSAVSYSFQNGPDVIETNLLGTVALAEAARDCDLKLFVQASTSEVYGRIPPWTRFPATEETPTGATSPYAVSKIAAEEYLRVLNNSYNFPTLILRPFNTYGRALINNNHFVVERAITQALTEKKISLHDPRPRRDFLFREDHVSAYLRVIDCVQNKQDLSGMILNITSGHVYTIDEMAHKVAQQVSVLTGASIECEFSSVPDRPLDIPILHGDPTKAFDKIRWKPKYSFEKGLEKAVYEWHTVLNK